VLALREGSDPDDARVGASATYGRDWLPAEHRRQVEYAQKQAVGRHAAPADTDTKL
jgi:hypothetical protein